MLGLVVFPPQVTVEDDIVELVAVLLLGTIAVVGDDTVVVGGIPSSMGIIGSTE